MSFSRICYILRIVDATVTTLRPILVVDDNPDDVFITRWIIQQAAVDNPIVTMDNGEDAIAFLTDCLATEWMPCVVLLDIKMPGLTGFEVLAWAKSHSRFARVSFIVLSTSSLPQDRARALSLGAVGYLVKYQAKETLPTMMQACCREVSFHARRSA